MTFQKYFPLLLAATTLTACTTAPPNLKATVTRGASVLAMGSGMSVQAPRGFNEMCVRRAELCDAAQTLTTASSSNAESGADKVAKLETRAIEASAAAEPTSTPAPALAWSARVEMTQVDFRKQTAGVNAKFDDEALQAALAAEAAGGATGSVEPVRTGATNMTMVAPLMIETPKSIVQAVAAGPTALITDPPQALLDAVNRRVNGMVRQQSDWATYQVEELWNRPIVTGGFLSGDCEDIAIEKRQELVEAGVDPKRMFFAVVYRRDVGLHVLLMVSTDRGDLALDSRSPWIEPWDKVPYIWVKRQLADNPREWVMVLPADAAPEPMRMTDAPAQLIVASR